MEVVGIGISLRQLCLARLAGSSSQFFIPSRILLSFLYKIIQIYQPHKPISLTPHQSITNYIHKVHTF